MNFLVFVSIIQLIKITESCHENSTNYLTTIINHYKSEDPIGIPGVEVPDPMDIPSFSHSFSMVKINFNTMKLQGLSKFKLEEVFLDVPGLSCKAVIKIKNLTVTGDYEMSSWFSTRKGKFIVKTIEVTVKGDGGLFLDKKGKLETGEVKMDISYETIDIIFLNIGVMSKILQGILNSVSSFVFKSIKPYVIKETNLKIKETLNEKLLRIDKVFPNSISPFDQLILDIRKSFATLGYDPYKLEDYSTSVEFFEFKMSNNWLFGASSFHREDKIELRMVNGTVGISFSFGTKKMRGFGNWKVFLGPFSKSGYASFDVEYVKIYCHLELNLKSNLTSTLKEFKVEVGTIQARFDGLGTWDYLVEFFINFLPNLIRHQVLTALEPALKKRLQEEINLIDMHCLLEKEFLDEKRWIEDFLNNSGYHK